LNQANGKSFFFCTRFFLINFLLFTGDCLFFKANGASNREGTVPENYKIFLGVYTVTKVKRISRIFFVFVTMLFVYSAAFGAEDVSKIIPADSLFCVQVNNLDNTLSQTDQFLSGVSPVPVMLQMYVRMGLAELLGNPALEGVNTAGSFAVFGKKGEGEPTDEMITIVIPIADYSKFLSACPNIDKPDANGVSVMKKSGGLLTQVGSFAVIKSPASYKDLLEIKKSAGAAGFKSLAAGLDSAAKVQASSSPVWIYGNMPEVEKTFGPQITAAFDEVKKNFAQMPAGTFGTAGNPAEIMDIYFDVIKSFISQSKYVSIAIKPQPDALTISTNVVSLPGTKMAEMFTVDAAKKENTLRPYLQNGAMMNYSGNITGKINAECTKLFIDWLSKKLTPEKAAKIQALAGEAASVFHGNEAVSVTLDPNSKPVFSAVCISEITDKDKFYKILDQAIELVNSGVINDLYKGMGVGLQAGITMKKGVENYNGVSIDSAAVTFKADDANSPPAQMIKQMYGDGLEYRWAIVNGLCIYTIGADNNGRLKKLIDQVKAGRATQVCSEVKDAMAMLPGSEKANFVGTFNYLRCFNILPAIMPMIPKMNLQSKSNLMFAGRFDNGSMTIDLAIPKTHLMELVQAVMLLQQNMMGQPQMVQPKAVDANSGK
jgi:hypothetical protein